MSMHHMPVWCPRRSEGSILSWNYGWLLRALDSLEPELQMVVGPSVHARNWTQVPWESSQCSQSLSHLSGPRKCHLVSSVQVTFCSLPLFFFIHHSSSHLFMHACIQQALIKRCVEKMVGESVYHSGYIWSSSTFHFIYAFVAVHSLVYACI